MSIIYRIKINVEDEKNIELVKNVLLTFFTYDDTTSLFHTENSYAEDKNKNENIDETISIIIDKNTITINFNDDYILPNQTMQLSENLLKHIATLLPDIDFELSGIPQRCMYSPENGIYKDGVMRYFAQVPTGEEIFIDENTSKLIVQHFSEGGIIVDGKYVSIENVNITNIVGQKFCFTDVDDIEKEFLTKLITRNGGIVRTCVSGKTDCLIYSSSSDYTTTVKHQKAKELKEKGKNIQILNVNEFYGNLCFSSKSDDYSDPLTIE